MTRFMAAFLLLFCGFVSAGAAELYDGSLVKELGMNYRVYQTWKLAVLDESRLKGEYLSRDRQIEIFKEVAKVVDFVQPATPPEKPVEVKPKAEAKPVTKPRARKAPAAKPEGGEE